MSTYLHKLRKISIKKEFRILFFASKELLPTRVNILQRIRESPILYIPDQHQITPNSQGVQFAEGKGVTVFRYRKNKRNFK